MSGQHSPLHAAHTAAGASFTDFGGWNMPVEYDGLRDEHHAVRDHAGRFDVSHMGQVTVSGPDATALLARLLPSDITELAVGESQYSAFLAEDGTMIDDVIVARWPDDEGPRYLVVPNVGNDDRIAEHARTGRDRWELTADVSVVTDEYAMLAVQGPAAPTHVASIIGEHASSIDRFAGRWTTYEDHPVFVSRTGYTGEDGFELLVPTAGASALWTAFDKVQACGLGARDTLRIEAGLLLSGQDFDPEERPVTPPEAGIGFIVDRTNEFIGRDRCLAHLEEGGSTKFVGLKLTDRGIPRHGYHIVTDTGDRIGTVTSGTLSPTFDEPLGLGYVDPSFAAPGTEVAVVIRGTEKRATITSNRFLDHL